MKKIFVMLVALAICLCFMGCNLATIESAHEQKEEENISMFVEVEVAGTWRVFYHRDTKVMYVVSFGGYNAGNFTLLVNPDGTPMLWEE